MDRGSKPRLFSPRWRTLTATRRNTRERLNLRTVTRLNRDDPRGSSSRRGTFGYLRHSLSRGNDVLVSFKIKDYFFDGAKVLAALNKAERKALSKAGAFVQTSAKRSLRRRKKPSQPGQTPSIYSKDKNRTLKKILFGYDPTAHSVIVGPVGFGRAEAPRALELGGASTVRVPKKNEGRRSSPAQAASFKRRKALGLIQRKPSVRRPIKVEPRPFMNPALKREAPKFPGLWAGAVK